MMKEKNRCAVYMAMSLVSATAYAGESQTIPAKHIQLEVGAGASQGTGNQGAIGSVSGAIQTDQYIYSGYSGHDSKKIAPDVAIFQPRLTGYVQKNLNTGRIDKYGAQLDFFKGDATMFPPNEGGDGKLGLFVEPHLGYERDNRLLLSRGPSLEFGSVSRTYKQGEPVIADGCAVKLPTWFVGPSKIGMAKVGVDGNWGVELAYAVDARCKASLGKVGQLEFGAGASGGVAFGDGKGTNGTEYDSAVIWSANGRVDLKQVGGTPIYVGTELRMDKTVLSIDSTADDVAPSESHTVRQATAHAGIAF